jgi:hypothetical protein
MKLTSTQKAEKIREAAEEVIARLKQWEEENHAPNLTQIEEEVLAVRRQFGEALVTVLVAGQEAQQPAAAPVCEGCGGEMTDKGRKARSVESRVGEVAIERGYYYCAHCRSGLFPPGPPTGVGGEPTE